MSLKGPFVRQCVKSLSLGYMTITMNDSHIYTVPQIKAFLKIGRVKYFV